MKITLLELHNLTTGFKILKISVLPFIGYSLIWPLRLICLTCALFFLLAWRCKSWPFRDNWQKRRKHSFTHSLSVNNQLSYYLLFLPSSNWLLFSTISSSNLDILYPFKKPHLWVFAAKFSSLMDADCSQLKFFPDKFFFTSKSLFQNWIFSQTKSVLAVKLFFWMLLNNIFFLSCKICRASQKLSLCTVSFSAIGPIKNTTMPEALFCWTTVQHSLSLDQIGIITQCSFKVITLSLKFSYLLPWSDNLSWVFFTSLNWINSSLCPSRLSKNSPIS